MSDQRLLWIRFDQEDRRMPAPDFSLEASSGGRQSLGDFRGLCNVVLFFAHGLDCPHCRAVLYEMICKRGDYISEGTRIGVILAQPRVDLAAQIAGDEHLGQFPLCFLSDPEGNTRRAYTGLMDESLTNPGDAVLFVLDSFGAPYAALIGCELDHPNVHQETLKWLDFIGRQCPE